jgi:hypothetical protein
MPIQVTAEEEISVGICSIVEGAAPESHYVAVFEDDGDTGYFYALDPSFDGNPIQDAVHIYNVSNVTDRAKPSVVKMAGLSIQGKPFCLSIVIRMLSSTSKRREPFVELAFHLQHPQAFVLAGVMSGAKLHFSCSHDALQPFHRENAFRPTGSKHSHVTR